MGQTLIRRPVRMQRPGNIKGSYEFIEKPIYLRYVFKVESTELIDGLDVNSKGERMSIVTPRSLVGAVGWMVKLYPGEGNTAGICLEKWIERE